MDTAAIKTKRCGRCGVILSPKVYADGETERICDFAVRQFCGKQCSAQSRQESKRATDAKVNAARQCRACGEPLVRKRYANRGGRYPAGCLEPRQAFLDRKFCGQPCGREWGKIGGMRSIVARRRAARRAVSTECTICGGVDHLVAHHKNGNFDDNAASNIQTLCRSCHSQQHWSNTWAHRRRRPCVVHGCGDNANGTSALCSKHYLRQRRAGGIHDAEVIRV